MIGLKSLTFSVSSHRCSALAQAYLPWSDFERRSDDLAVGPMGEVPVSARALASDSMSHLLVEGQQPVVPLPEREPAAIRAAVARIDPAALARFEADWTAATARARAASCPVLRRALVHLGCR